MEEPEAKFARVAALKMADILHKRAVQYICGTKDVPSLAMSLEELRQMDEIKVLTFINVHFLSEKILMF
jgi:hypothetical protein